MHRLQPATQRLLLVLCLIATHLTAHAEEADNSLYVENWEYKAQVHANNSWDIVETLRVNFVTPHHGIYRNIPRRFVNYHTNDGKRLKYTYHIDIDNVKVGGGEFTTDDNADSQDNLIIRIGSEDKTVTGEHTYVIRYTLNYYDDRWPKGDELLHTVLGTGWTTKIDTFAFNVTFDNSLPADFAKNMRVYSGPWDKRENALGVKAHVEGNSIVGSITDVPAYQAITLWAPLPEGYWQGTYNGRKGPLTRSSTASTGCGIAAAVIFCILICYFMHHRRRRPTVVIEYNAPDGISSAEVGTIIDDKADISDLTSLIVWWASKGHLIISETHTGHGKAEITLTKVCDLPDDAPDYQHYFWNAFFDGRDSVDLKNLGDQHTSIRCANLALYRHFSGSRRLVKFNFLPIALLMAFIGAGFVAIGLGSSVEAFDYDLTHYGCIWAATVAIGACCRLALSGKDMMRSRTEMYMMMMLFAGACVAELWYLKNSEVYNAPDSLQPLAFYAAITVAGWVLAYFANNIKQDTPYRLKQMSLLLGFREFIEKAELPMLKALVDEDPKYFYNVLPYAMVFGLSDKWREQFKDIELTPPDWYQTDTLGTGLTTPIMTHSLVNSLTRNFDREISNAVAKSSVDPAAHSSSGGGGGFSGGGGGGGGGGGW